VGSDGLTGIEDGAPVERLVRQDESLLPGAPLSGHSVITRTVTVAEGVFAPGHLGELTRIIPFEMVDAVLAECGAAQRRVRKLPARVTVYLLLAAAFFQDCGYLGVWSRLTAGLSGLPVARITATALWHARSRVGVRPLQALFDLVRGPALALRTGATHFAGMLVVAIDGTYLDVPEGPRTAALTKGSNQYATSGYPQICLSALVACGTRAILDAAFGSRERGETHYARRLTRSIHPGMIVLLDRGFSGNDFLAHLARTQAAFLARFQANRKPVVLRRLPDGSFLSRFAALPVRVIECEITIATSAGRRTGTYRLATNLLDHRRYPAADLITLYHQRWEIESAYFEIKKTLLGRRVLRARSLPGIAQEIYAILTAYQAIRIAMADATATRPGTDPDRASFTVALHAARDQIIQAQGVIAETTIDLAGTIGRAVLDQLMPARRLRLSPRAVKRPMSRYAYKSLRVDRRTYQATLTMIVLTGGPEP
jgi:hypothetical protein